MKSRPNFLQFISLFFALLSLPLQAQLVVQASLERFNYIPYEGITLNVSLLNQSGRSITFGKHDGKSWLHVEIKDLQGRLLGNNSEVSTDPFVLRNGESRTYSVQLNSLADLTQVGNFQAVASVYYPPLDQVFLTKPQRFQVRDGIKLWERRIGLTPQGTQAAQLRNYELIQAQIKEYSFLFVRVSDPNRGRFYASYPLGSLVPHSAPQIALDPQGILHVVYRATADRWVYQRIDHMGNLVEDRVMASKGKVPKLSQLESGLVLMDGPPTVDAQRQLDKQNDPNRARESAISKRPEGLNFGAE